MSNPLRAAEWRCTLTPERDDDLITALCEMMNLCCNEAEIERTMEAYAAYLLSELEREQRELAAKYRHARLVNNYDVVAEAVAAFRKRVMGE